MAKSNNTVNELFICQCYNTEHQLIFSYIPEYDSVYMSIYLIPEHRWWKRVWTAIKYIFGYRSRYGYFDEFIFNNSDADRLQKIVDYLKSCA